MPVVECKIENNSFKEGTVIKEYQLKYEKWAKEMSYNGKTE